MSSIILTLPAIDTIRERHAQPCLLNIPVQALQWQKNSNMVRGVWRVGLCHVRTPDALNNSSIVKESSVGAPFSFPLRCGMVVCTKWHLKVQDAQITSVQMVSRERRHSSILFTPLTCKQDQNNLPKMQTCLFFFLYNRSSWKPVNRWGERG